MANLKRIAAILLSSSVVAGCSGNQAVIPTQMVLPSATVFVSPSPTLPTSTALPSLTPSAAATQPLTGDRATHVAAFNAAERICDLVSDLEGSGACQGSALPDTVSIEIVVEDGFNTLEMAQRIMAAARLTVGESAYFFALVQGDGRLTNYAFNDGEWRTDELTPLDAPLVEPDGA